MDGPLARPQDVRLPPSLMYPVEITSVQVDSGAAVRKHDVLLQYKYWNEVPEGTPDPAEGEEPQMVTKEFYATFESPTDGQVAEFLVQIGDRINDAKTAVLRIAEPCDHSVQYGGLCAICGNPVDDADYMGYNDSDRAPIAMSHDTSGLTVSLDEATRIEKASNARLLKDRKLILVVDLDQTVIHAAVDPNVGKWMNDTESPNHEAVQEVKSFMLREMRPDGPVNCWYYVKLRPGLAEFLEKMHEKFEMHIYTMATKVYAREIAKLVDPDGTYFADRILSREESGNLLQKNISRLFPVTTSLVTIIDDRGDVWQWSPHLVRVFPYNFFSGTGDINSSYLPQRSGLVTPATGTAADPDSKNAPSTPKPLQDNDKELDNLTRILRGIYDQYYKDYDYLQALPAAKRQKELHRYSHQPFKNSATDDVPDVGVIMPRMKQQVFDGCVFLFSGIFPLGTSLDSADIVQWVRSFGAVVVAEFIPAVTHVIADSGGTLKARQGEGAGKHVVSIGWVFACLEGWQRLSEDKHKLQVSDPIAPKHRQKHRESSGAGSASPVRNGGSNNGATGANEDSPSGSGSDSELDSDLPANCDEPEAEVARNFVRSLSRGGLDWEDVDEELREMMGSDASEAIETDDEDDEDKANSYGAGAGSDEHSAATDSTLSNNKRRWSETIQPVDGDADEAKRNKRDGFPEPVDEADEDAADAEDNNGVGGEDDDDSDFAAELAREMA